MGVVTAAFGAHLFLTFIIGLRFIAPFSTDVVVVQHTVQLVPRLPEPTLVTAVLVKPDVPVKKGQPLFQFDRRPYEYQVRTLQAQLNAATASAASADSKVTQLHADLASSQQGVQMDKASLDAVEQKIVKAKSAWNTQVISKMSRVSPGKAQGRRKTPTNGSRR